MNTTNKCLLTGGITWAAVVGPFIATKLLEAFLWEISSVLPGAAISSLALLFGCLWIAVAVALIVRVWSKA